MTTLTRQPTWVRLGAGWRALGARVATSSAVWRLSSLIASKSADSTNWSFDSNKTPPPGLLPCNRLVINFDYGGAAPGSWGEAAMTPPTVYVNDVNSLRQCVSMGHQSCPVPGRG